MPELPEVESVRLALSPLIGRAVEGVRVARRDVVRDGAGRRRGRLDPADLLVGDRVASLERRGKQLAIVGRSGRAVLVHLGMSGQVLVNPGDAMPGHRHAAWTVAGVGEVVFRDPRRFGGLWLLASRAALNARWDALGVDGLLVTGQDLSRALGRSRRAVKAALLDQGAVAGVGNIYADEALFAAGVLPQRACETLTADEWGRVADAVRAVLALAIDAGGSTLRDYRRPDGSAGGAKRGHRVYGRKNEPCVVCSTPIRAETLAQRTTCWCPRCQH